MAAPSPLSVLLLVFLLEVKHFLCDGPLQTRAMIAGKSNYGQPVGLLHGALHGAFSLFVLGIWGVPWLMAAALAATEAAVHYHIDHVKERLAKHWHLTVRDSSFWWLLSADQALHHFTYLVMAAAVVRWT